MNFKPIIQFQRAYKLTNSCKRELHEEIIMNGINFKFLDLQNLGKKKKS